MLELVTKYNHWTPGGIPYVCEWHFNHDDQKFYRSVNSAMTTIGMRIEDVPAVDKCRTPYSQAVAQFAQKIRDKNETK